MGLERLGSAEAGSLQFSMKGSHRFFCPIRLPLHQVHTVGMLSRTVFPVMPAALNCLMSSRALSTASMSSLKNSSERFDLSLNHLITHDSPFLSPSVYVPFAHHRKAPCAKGLSSCSLGQVAWFARLCRAVFAHLSR